MHYKTITLELLQQRPALYEKLRKDGELLATTELLASDLKSRHEAWRKNLTQARPDNSEIQIDNEALEMALDEFQEHLDSGSSLAETLVSTREGEPKNK